MKTEEEYEDLQNQGKIENRPATIKDLEFTIDLLNKHNIPYLLIGGFALLLQGNQRTTTDIDILLPLNNEIGQKIKTALRELPQNVIKEVDDSWFEEDETIRVADEFTIDLLFKCGGGIYNYENLKQHAEEKEINGIKVHTIDVYGLLKTKQTGREKDLADIHFLNQKIERMNGITTQHDLNTGNFNLNSFVKKVKKRFF
jgi:hypothetical protein